MNLPSGAPRRLIGLVDATALVVGSMIGSGIFIVSAESARLTGTPGRLLLVWALAGFLFGWTTALVIQTGTIAAVAVAFAKFLVGPAFSQSAWTNVTFPGAEVAEPGRTFPRALLLGCALVAGLYVLANVGYLRTRGAARSMSHEGGR